MRLLLDTQSLIWYVDQDHLLSRSAHAAITDPQNDLLLSAATIWEIAIKHALVRGNANDMPISGPEALGYFRAAGFQVLDISPAHAAAVETLPPLHSDPFDRLLVAQAMTVPLRLVTHDQSVAAYSDSIIVV